MNGKLRELLRESTGQSEHVLVIVVDIRGFSSFCQKIESFDVANYIKIVYSKIIDSYFPKASYYKPTGDGLLIVYAVPSKSFKEFMIEQTQACLNLLNDFGEICKDEPLINYKTPTHIGIGVARGSACKISSNSEVVDYSGRVLNLAARLMNIARPSGVVLDSSIGFKILPTKIQDDFMSENIYVRGIAEDEPITVYYTKRNTIIPSTITTPSKEPIWKTEKKEFTYKQIRELNIARIRFDLDAVPSDLNQVYLEVSRTLPDKRRILVTFQIEDKEVSYKKIGGTPCVYLNKKGFLNYFKDLGVDDEIVTFEIIYPQ